MKKTIDKFTAKDIGDPVFQLTGKLLTTDECEAVLQSKGGR